MLDPPEHGSQHPGDPGHSPQSGLPGQCGGGGGGLHIHSTGQFTFRNPSLKDFHADPEVNVVPQ